MESSERPIEAGRSMLEHVKSIFIQYGYKEVKILTDEYPCFVVNKKYFKDLYGSKSKTHLIGMSERYPNGIAIDVRWQAVGGTVDQKYPFIFMSLEHYPCPTAMIIEGGGMRREAVDWLRDRATNKNMLFESLGEFSRWAREGLK